MGDVCGHCGGGVAGGCSCGPDSPQGCPAIRPLRIGVRSIAIRKVSGSKDVPAGGACPAPTDGEKFAAVAGQGQPRNVPAGRIARKGALQSGPYGGVCVRHQSAKFRAARMFLRAGRAPPLRWGKICGHRETEVVTQRAAGRMAREGALQSGPYG